MTISSKPITASPEKFWTVFSRSQWQRKSINSATVVENVVHQRDADTFEAWGDVLEAIDGFESDLISVIETNLTAGTIRDVSGKAVDDVRERSLEAAQ